MIKFIKTNMAFIKKNRVADLMLMVLICFILSGCGPEKIVDMEKMLPTARDFKQESNRPVTDSFHKPTHTQSNFIVATRTLTPTFVLAPAFDRADPVYPTLEQTYIPMLEVISTPTRNLSPTHIHTSEPTQKVLISTEEADAPAGEPTEEETQYLPLIIHEDVPTPTATPIQPVMVFSDEFNGTSLNQKKWETQYPWGGTIETNNELECYSPNSVSLQDGILRLTAIEKTITCMGIYVEVPNLPYRSGMIASHSHFSFRYGFAEIRAKIPAGPGLWPTFWLLPEVEAPNTIDWPPEIDILEILGNEPTKLYMGNWDGDEFTPIHYAGDYVGPDFSADFHVFGLRWTPDILIWYVDGIERFRSDQGVPTVPMYLITNLAVGGNWPGPPNEDTEFPSTFEVDYIRVYDEGF